MLTAVAFVPGAPLMVPELSGPGATADTGPMRSAVHAAAAELAEVADVWLAIGAVDGLAATGTSGVPRTGTFAGFGVDVRVSLDPTTPVGRAGGDPTADTMPTPMLIAGWIRGTFAADHEVWPVLLDAALSPQGCADKGAELAERLYDDGRRVGVLAVADGSTGLTDRAPAGLVEGARALQDEIDDALANGDLDALAGLGPQRCADGRVAGRVVWQTVAALWTAVGHTSPRARSLYRAAPFGVGYHVARWYV